MRCIGGIAADAASSCALEMGVNVSNSRFVIKGLPGLSLPPARK
jgi:hypothetical protein